MRACAATKVARSAADTCGSASARGRSMSRMVGLSCIQVGIASALVTRELPGADLGEGESRHHAFAAVGDRVGSCREIWLPMQ